MEKCHKKGAAVDSVILTAVKLITYLLTFIITKILSERLSLEIYGEYSAARVVMDIGKDFCILGLLDAANYFFMRAGSLQEQRKTVNHIVLIEVCIAAVFAILIILFSSSISTYFGIPAMKSLIYIVAWIPLFTNIIGIYQVFFVSIQRAGVIGIFTFAAMIFKLIYVTVICLSTMSVRMIFICMLAAEVLQAVLMILLFAKFSGIPLTCMPISRAGITKILRFAIPMGAYIWMNSLNREVDKLVVGNLGTTAELALYSNAARLLPFDILTASFITVLIPYITFYLAEGNHKKAASTFSAYIQISLIGIWVLAGGIFLAPEGLISILYGEKYIVVKSVFLIYIVVDMIRFAQTSIIFSAMHKSELLLRYSAVMLAGNLVLNIVLFPVMGLPGPAVSTLTVNLIMTGYMLWKGSALIGQPVSAFLPFKVFLGQLLRLGICILAGYFIHRLVLQTGLCCEAEFIVTYAGYLAVAGLVHFKRIKGLLNTINHLEME